MSALRLLFATALVLLSPMALATGTGPTHPEKTRQGPLDTSEPRQEVIEQERGEPGQQRGDEPRELPAERRSTPPGKARGTTPEGNGGNDEGTTRPVPGS